ncbi:MAG: flagellar basal-body MS-ring/collar protein FliF [Proteobacteria bacterium]|nr:flagellar basal-body MS-ring/collar protein FliF [Pseudomonadota bacterium]
MATAQQALPPALTGQTPMGSTALGTTSLTSTPMTPALQPVPGGTGLALPQATPLTMLASLGGILRQPAVRKSAPAILVLAMLVIFGAIYAWTQEAPYRGVFPGMAEADQQSALETLKAANFNPRIDAATGQLAVPAARYHEARILLASQGIPRTQGRGILDSLKDHSAMTTSQFMEQARYSAAIEQELAKSITQIGTIQSARVHLAQTKQSPFAREQTPVKASVIVTPFSGRLVSPNQVQAIVHLVASSVPYLSAGDVSVVDNLGNLISKSPVEGPLGLTSIQSQHKQQTEETYRSRILQLLEPVVGEGNVRAQVDLVMNFTQVETATEDFDTRKEGSKTRSEVLAEERAAQLDPLGVPGALSNAVPPESKSTSDTASTEEKKDSRATVSSKSTRNYELDKTVRHVKNSQGGIDRVSVAVVIKERAPAAKEKDKDASAPAAAVPSGYSPEELERLSGLVKGVVGFSQTRGDVVNLMQAKFEPVAASGSGVWYENDVAVSSIKVGLATLVLVVILLAVVRPVLKSYLPQAPVAAPVLPAPLALAGKPGEAGAEAGTDAKTEGPSEDGEAGEHADEDDSNGMSMVEVESLEEFKARLKKSAAPKKSSISAEMLDTANSYDDKVALVRMLVSEDSGRVAAVLKNMIKQDMAA